MYITCLDVEGVLVPEIWVAFAEESGIPELKRTTRDEPDYDNSKLLSAKEAFYLAIALSLDSLAVGFGSGLGYVNYAQVIILCFLVGIVCLRVGSQLGRHFANIMNVNLSWLSGVLLIILAFIRTF